MKLNRRQGVTEEKLPHPIGSKPAGMRNEPLHLFLELCLCVNGGSFTDDDDAGHGRDPVR